MSQVRHHITAAFLPLLDSALLVVAAARGFAEHEGVELALVKETSWASIRDRMAVGHFEVAHMLAPMPIASNLGITSLPLAMLAPMALGLGGNAVTVSGAVWRELADAGASGDLAPRAVGDALRAVVDARARASAPRLRFAVVHPHSGHNFELRYWLAACGIDPDREVELAIAPPPLMADALSTGRIDGFCVGEPWNTVAVARAGARIVTVKSRIWRSSPEKVLGVAAAWAQAQPEALAALLRAMYQSARWCQDPSHHGELADLLAQAQYLDQSSALLLPAITGRLQVAQDEYVDAPQFFIPCARAATFPWQSHALWFYSQMVRWGQVAHSAANADIARHSYRPDLYRAALTGLDAPVPAANAKVEGALGAPVPVGVSRGTLELGPDGFFDGRIFDPDRLEEYLLVQRGEK